MTYGSTRGMVSQNQSAVTDEQGNGIVNAGNSFGDSPAGTALLTQALFGLPNGTFSLTPPDVYSAISVDNQIPYWLFEDNSLGIMSGSAIYDTTAQTWGVIIDPGTASVDSYCTLTTRSYLINDDNLGLRQKATTVISKSGTAAVSTQWNLTLSATYYDSTNIAISTAIIGTALDTGTWTSISGFTTTGGSAISASARYVDLQYKLTATAAITGSAKVTIKSILLSTKIGANASFNVSDVFVANGTWTRPAGVDYVTVLGIGGGGGGAGGPCILRSFGTANASSLTGSSGGGGSRVSYFPNFYVGDQSTITVGIGAGGSGGTATSFSKTLAQSTQGTANGTNGSNGGATTFGSYFTINGGGGGIGGTVYTASGSAGVSGGTAAGASTTIVYGAIDSTGGAGGISGSATTTAATNNALAPGTTSIAGVTYLPFVSAAYAAAGVAGGAGSLTSSGTVRTGIGTAGALGASGFIAGGGSSGGIGNPTGNDPTPVVGNSSAGGSGGAGGGGASAAGNIRPPGNGTAVILAGAGGSASAYSGAGGGGGGAAAFQANSAATTMAGTVTSGAGGNGGGGIIVVGYTS